jgi:hypothetical protein
MRPRPGILFPAKTLTTLPATQKLFSTAEAIASSLVQSVKKESILGKENPKASVNKLIPVRGLFGIS